MSGAFGATRRAAAMPARKDRRRIAALLTLGVVLVFGAALDRRGDELAPVRAEPSAAEVQRQFDAAVLLLHARQHEAAALALQRVLEMAPGLVEARVNLGYALIGLSRPLEARRQFEQALASRAQQANAYYGLALAHEAAGDLELATGAMRSYLHLARDERPEHLARARAALWEWQATRRKAASASAGRTLASGAARP